jgi:hypothetical protein
MPSKYMELAQRVANLYTELPEVQAVALSGSLGGNLVDAASDIDLYVYTRSDIPLDVRQQIVEHSGGASRADVGLNYWGPGDEWFDAASGIEVDMVYFEAAWMEDQIQRAMRDHVPSLGYSTCFAFTMHHSQIFYDPQGWFTGLQAISQQLYPEALRRNIVRHNHPVLRKIIPSYFFQLEKAVKRCDLVSVNHRLTGLLASYFDILFALNRQLHPGEKRMVEKAVASCERLPENFEAEIAAVLAAAGAPDTAFLTQVTRLLDHLDKLLAQEGFRL